MEIVLHSMAEYPQVIRHVMRYGERRAPRGQMTADAGFVSVIILNPRNAMPLGLGRNLNPAIGAVEAIQLIAGYSDPQLVLKVAPQFERYADHSEDGTQELVFWGAYGDRINSQVGVAIRKLSGDPLTRQAIITLWDPWLDNLPGKHDYPCTIALQFFVRDGLLDMNTIMRSNDVWLGMPYDVFQFTQLQATVARCLGTVPGTYRHTALSMHLYERDMDAAMTLLDNYSPQDARQRSQEIWQPDGIGEIGEHDFGKMMLRAQQLMQNRPIIDETPSERWYRGQLHPSTSNVG